VFHVGLLKKFQGPTPDTPPPLPPLHHGAVAPEPERAIRFRLDRGVHQVLVQWRGESAASATWEDVEPFRAKYPAFQLEDKLLLDRGEMSWSGARIPGAAGPMTCAATRSAHEDALGAITVSG